MQLAWLSTDENARAVAGTWRSFSRSPGVVSIADLVHGASIARAADITVATFFRSVYQTGMELNALFPRLPELRPVLMQPEPISLSLDLPKYQFRLNRRRALWKAHAFDYVVSMRRRWQLTQTQFADLLMLNARTLQDWEAHGVAPSIRHQWFLLLFRRYVKEHGIAAFRKRFVAQAW